MTMKIRASRGKHGFLMNANKPMAPNEHEVLLPRGSKFRVIDVKRDENGHYHMLTELV